MDSNLGSLISVATTTFENSCIDVNKTVFATFGHLLEDNLVFLSFQHPVTLDLGQHLR